MALIVVLASGLAAMKVASPVVFQALFGLSLLVLLISTLGAMVRRQREAWVGFSLFGWSYALVALVPAIKSVVLPMSPLASPIQQFTNWLHPALPFPLQPLPYIAWKEGESYRRLIRGATEDFRPGPDEVKIIDDYEVLARPSQNRADAKENAPLIAHTFLGIAFAISGAAIGKLLSDRSFPASVSPESPTSNLGR
jgi:hypothetical protein